MRMRALRGGCTVRSGAERLFIECCLRGWCSWVSDVEDDFFAEEANFLPASKAIGIISESRCPGRESGKAPLIQTEQLVVFRHLESFHETASDPQECDDRHQTAKGKIDLADIPAQRLA